MSHRRRVHALLALALAALVALPALAVAAGPGASAPAAHAAKRSCRARGRAGARRCRRAVSKVPATGTTLTSADGKLRLTVVAGRGANGKPAKFVAVEWDLTATCTTGPAGVHLRARATVRGNAFASTVDNAGVKQQLTGHFESAHKAVGEGQLSFPTPGGDTCGTGVQHFTAQG